MATRDRDLRQRLEAVRASGIPFSAADEARVGDSIAASLKALDKAVTGSLFDTEPQTFDVTLRKLARKEHR